MTNPLVSLFGTAAITGTGAGVTQDILFAGADGGNPLGNVAANRVMSPPQSGVIRKVTLRTISITDLPGEGVDYRVRLFGTRIRVAALESQASMAASFIGESLAPLTPTIVDVADPARVDPDLDQNVNWYYNLSPLVTGPGGDPGAVPASVPGLLARIDIGAFTAPVVITIGIGLIIESLQPGFPEAPLFQRGGTSLPVPWPQNTTT